MTQKTTMKKRSIFAEAAVSLLKRTLTYKTVNVFICIFSYIKSRLYIKDTLYSEQFKYVLKKYLKADFKEDWIGRLYAVVNPAVDINGNIDFGSQIIEFTEDGMSTDNYVKSWVLKQMSLIKSVFNLQQSGFFDYINAEFRHVGPENADNWLVVFDLVDRKILVSSIYKEIKQILLYGAIGLAVYLVCSFAV